MDSAYNYYDFTDRLVERVCTEKSTDNLIHLAAIHTTLLENFRIYERLREKHYQSLLARPYLLFRDAKYGEMPSLYDEAKSAIDLVLSSNPDDWIALHMHHLAAEIGDILGRFHPYYIDALDKMKQLMENCEALACFNTFYLEVQAFQYVRVDSQEAARIMTESYECALQFDDQVSASNALNLIALLLRSHEPTRVFQLVSKADELANKLGLASSIFHSLRIRGQIHSARGEYSAVLDCYQGLIDLAEKAGEPTMGEIPHSMAVNLNEIREYEEALEWGKMAIKTMSTPWAFPLAYFDVARSLLNLGRLDEAKTYLNEARKILLKTGDEFHLLVEYFNWGLLEMVEGRPLEAMESLERAFEIAERIERQRRMNDTLCALTECEIALYTSPQKDEYSGPWMKRLEQEVAEKDIPGIEGRLLLLKAKLRLIQGRKEEAEELLFKVSRLAEDPGVRYLADWVSELKAKARFPIS